MFDPLSIIKALSASSGLFGMFKEEAERKKAEKFLMEKYSLTIPSRIVQVGQYPRWQFYYPEGGWEKALVNLLNEIINAQKLDIEVCEKCGDLFLFLKVLSSILQDSKQYISKSSTIVNLSELARGNATDLSLKIVQNDLVKWKKIDGDNFLKGSY